jgi:hypothetical protein
MVPIVGVLEKVVGVLLTPWHGKIGLRCDGTGIERASNRDDLGDRTRLVGINGGKVAIGHAVLAGLVDPADRSHTEDLTRFRFEGNDGAALGPDAFELFKEYLLSSKLD